MKQFVNNEKDLNSDKDEDEDDCYGPALPPHLKQVKCEASTSSIENTLQSAGSNDPEEAYDSSDGEIIGPLPPKETDYDNSSAADLERRSLKMKKKLLGGDADGDQNPTRETWMTELPELLTKNFGLGPRSFNRSDKPKITGRDEWTSTPQTQNEKPKEKEEDEEEMRNHYLEQKRNKELEKVIKEHDKSKKRSKSLLSAHQKEMKKRKKEEDSKPKERKAFDRDADLKLNKLDDAKRKALIRKSQELNSKFKIGGQKFL